MPQDRLPKYTLRPSKSYPRRWPSRGGRIVRGRSSRATETLTRMALPSTSAPSSAAMASSATAEVGDGDEAEAAGPAGVHVRDDGDVGGAVLVEDVGEGVVGHAPAEVAWIVEKGGEG